MKASQYRVMVLLCSGFLVSNNLNAMTNSDQTKKESAQQMELRFKQIVRHSRCREMI